MLKIDSLLSLIVLCLFSCAQPVSDDSKTETPVERTVSDSYFYGEWKIVDMQIDAPQISPEVLVQGRAEALSSSYLLSKQGELELTSNLNRRPKKGKWHYSSEKKELQISYPSDAERGAEYYEVTQQDETRMSWSMQVPSMGEMIVSLEKTAPDA